MCCGSPATYSSYLFVSDSVRWVPSSVSQICTGISRRSCACRLWEQLEECLSRPRTAVLRTWSPSQLCRPWVRLCPQSRSLPSHLREGGDGCLCVVISHTATQDSLVSRGPTLASAAPHKSITRSWNYRADFINHFKGSRINPLPSQTFDLPGSLTMPDWMNKEG